MTEINNCYRPDPLINNEYKSTPLNQINKSEALGNILFNGAKKSVTWVKGPMDSNAKVQSLGEKVLNGTKAFGRGVAFTIASPFTLSAALVGTLLKGVGIAYSKLTDSKLTDENRIKKAIFNQIKLSLHRAAEKIGYEKNDFSESELRDLDEVTKKIYAEYKKNPPSEELNIQIKFYNQEEYVHVGANTSHYMDIETNIESIGPFECDRINLQLLPFKSDLKERVIFDRSKQPEKSALKKENQIRPRKKVIINEEANQVDELPNRVNKGRSHYYLRKNNMEDNPDYIAEGGPKKEEEIQEDIF